MYKTLIVDDEALVRKGMRHMFAWSEYGLEIAGEAANGHRALELLARDDYQLVLADITMPGMSGMQLMTEIHDKYPDIGVVILTCHQDFEYIQEALRKGALDYIVKTQLEDLDTDDVFMRIVSKLKQKQNRDDDMKQIGRSLHSEQWRQLQTLYRSELFETMLTELSRLPESSLRSTLSVLVTHWQRRLPFEKVEEYLKQGAEVFDAHVDIRLQEWLGCLRTVLDGQLRQSNQSEEVIMAIIKAVDIMNEEPGRRISQEELCKQIGLSVSYFSKCFKQIMKMSFISYQQEVMFMHACDLLKHTNQPIYAVAEHSGFQDDKYFSRMFRERAGMQPREFRNRHR